MASCGGKAPTRNPGLSGSTSIGAAFQGQASQDPGVTVGQAGTGMSPAREQSHITQARGADVVTVMRVNSTDC